MSNCPICKSKLSEVYLHGCCLGVEESKYECLECNSYSEVFAYGSSEFYIGDFITGYHHSATPEEKKRIAEKIIQLGALYSK